MLLWVYKWKIPYKLVCDESRRCTEKIKLGFVKNLVILKMTYLSCFGHSLSSGTPICMIL
jgi:hypothetical protein